MGGLQILSSWRVGSVDCGATIIMLVHFHFLFPSTTALLNVADAATSEEAWTLLLEELEENTQLRQRG